MYVQLRAKLKCSFWGWLLLTLGTTSIAFAETQPPAGDQSGLEADVVVNYFANAALLYDRGVALFGMSSPSTLSDSHNYYLVYHSEEIHNYLGITDGQLRDFRELKRRATTTRGPQTREAKLAEWHARPQEPTRPFGRMAVALGVDFTPEQVGKSPLICLNFEGLLALSRPEFGDLVGISDEKRRQVASLAREAGSNADQFHRSRFVLRNEELVVVPELILSSRRVASELDQRIANLLSEEEKHRLAELLIEAARDAELIRGPEAGDVLRRLVFYSLVVQD